LNLIVKQQDLKGEQAVENQEKRNLPPVLQMAKKQEVEAHFFGLRM
jgi:hypothetical protein